MPDGSSVVIHALGFFPSVFLMFSWKLVSGSFLTYEFLSKKKRVKLRQSKVWLR